MHNLAFLFFLLSSSCHPQEPDRHFLNGSIDTASSRLWSTYPFTEQPVRTRRYHPRRPSITFTFVGLVAFVVAVVGAPPLDPAPSFSKAPTTRSNPPTTTLPPAGGAHRSNRQNPWPSHVPTNNANTTNRPELLTSKGELGKPPAEKKKKHLHFRVYRATSNPTPNIIRYAINH